MRKRRAFWIFAILPVLLFVTARQKASWRPRLIVSAKQYPTGMVVNSLGELVAASNRFLVFYDSDDTNSAPSHLHFIDNQNRIRTLKSNPGESYPSAAFTSPETVAVLHTDFEWESDNLTISGQVIDCRTLHPVLKLEPVLRKNSTDVMAESKVFIDQESILLVNAFFSYKWSLKSGHLMSSWKLKQPKDDSFLTDTVYIPNTKTFLQIAAGRIRVWDAKTGKLQSTSRKLADFDTEYGEHDPPGYSKFSPDGKVLVYETILADYSAGPLNIARYSDAKVLWSLPMTKESPDPDLNYVNFSGDSKELFIWHSSTHSFTVHDPMTGRIFRNLSGPPSLDDFWFTPDSSAIFTMASGNLWHQRAR